MLYVSFLVCPAKLNLFLNVTGQRPDGFHNLNSVFLRLNQFADTLIVSPADQPGIHFSCSRLELAGPDNSVVKAYKRFYQAFTQFNRLPLKVYLNKVIPVQAGLGGGSSNAASMLKYLANKHGIHWQDPHLQYVAADVGSDVPFFLSPYEAAQVTGRGEHVTPIALGKRCGAVAWPWLIIQPDTPMSTPAAYQRLRQRNQYSTHDMTDLLSALAYDGLDFQYHMLNDFELVNHPTEASGLIWQVMMSLGCKRPILCGSGSAMAGLISPEFQEKPLKKQLKEALPAHWFWRLVPSNQSA